MRGGAGGVPARPGAGLAAVSRATRASRGRAWPGAWLSPAVLVVMLGLAGRAARADAPVTTERREVIVPCPNAERVHIDNPLGRVQVRAWNRPGEIHVVAEKRAGSAAALDQMRVHYRAWASGEVQIEARVELGGREHAMPLGASGVDLLVEVPPEMELTAKTFGGDVSASGLRAGARLETTGGRIGVSDVHGRVVTKQLRGGQTVVDVEGDVELEGIEGDLLLRALGGGRVDARVVDGRIEAERLRSDWIRLESTTGQVLFIGVVPPGAHVELRSYAGDVRLSPTAPLPALVVRTRSPAPLDAAMTLRHVTRDGDHMRALYGAEGREGRALVELTSVLGRVSIQPR